MENLVKNVMKTAAGIKFFSAIFGRTYYGLYMCHFFVAVACLSKVMTRGVILHFPTEKEP